MTSPLEAVGLVAHRPERRAAEEGVETFVWLAWLRLADEPYRVLPA